MFRQQSSQRIFLYRSAFLLVGLAPTLAVLALIGGRLSEAMTIGSPVSWETALSNRLGLSVAVGQVSRPASGITSLHRLSLSDPETGELVLRIERLDVDSSAAAAHQFVVSRVEVAHEHLGRLWESLRDRVLRSELAQRQPFAVHVQQLTVQGASVPWSVSEAEALLEPIERGVRISAEFQVAGQNERTPARLLVSRHRHVDPPTTELELHTGEIPLPCALAHDLLPQATSLGSAARFQGSVRASFSALGWEGDVAGRFLRIDLDELMTANFPHKLSGFADVQLQGLHFAAGRIVSAAGDLRARDGVVSHSLFLAGREHLQFTLASRAESQPRRLWPYELLALSFEIDQQGTMVTGTCDQQGTFIRDSQGILAASRPQEPVGTLALIRSLVPESELQAPATRETEKLLRVLPLPAVVPPQQARNPEPYSGLRLNKRK